jgi:hypothetical protein
MRYLIKIIVGLLLLVVMVAPASALITNVSISGNTTLSSSSFVHDSHYMPDVYVYVLIVIGLICLIGSRAIPDAEDILCICAPLPIGLSAWFANYMTQEYIHTIYSGTNVIVTNVQVITPSPYLSITMVVILIVAIVNLIWILFLKEADKKTGGKKDE